ncbi:MAG: RNA methyltransferase [Anaerolineaceae bacterium]|nr:RNA methyltransferase [Anaerolineaceae bacterium]
MISSLQNSRIKWARALINQKQERKKSRAFIIEGVRLVEEALSSGWCPNFLFYSGQLSVRGQALVAACIQAGYEVEEVAPRIMDKIAAVETSQGILAVLPERQPVLPNEMDFAIIGDSIRDPGNLGALLRSAAAAGVQAVFLTPGSADPFSPKVLRAGMGAHFKLPILTQLWPDIQMQCKSFPTPLQLFLAEAQKGLPYWQADLRVPLALIIGGEAEGADPAIQKATDKSLQIPMPGGFESLNAAVAAGVLIFEVVRQRSS